jgi:type IV pilus assembly protein PilN
VVTINLLPRKQKKISFRIPPFILFLSVIWLAGAIYLGMMYYNARQEIQSLMNGARQQERQVTNASQKLQEAQEGPDIQSYLALSNKLQYLFYPTTLLLDEIAYNLPSNGKITQISYGLDGKVMLGGRFERLEDIAAYLRNLQMSQHVIQATVKSVTAVPVKWPGTEQETEVAANSPSLQIVGGNVVPRYNATFELKMTTIDLKKLEEQTPAAENKSTQTKKVQ